MISKNKAVGCLVGLAVGDAVGTTLEFTKPGANGLLPKNRWLTDMVGGGPFGLPKGGHTDDTSMALALADSIVQHGWDVSDQMQRFVNWRQDGAYSVKGYCFDIGGATSRSLGYFAKTGDPYAGAPTDAGNGALMRLAPVPIYGAHMSPFDVAELAREESSLTHGHQDSADCCEAFALLCWAAIRGASKDELFDLYKTDLPIRGKARMVLGSRSYLQGPPQVTGSGYVLRTFEAALWAFAKTDNYKDAILLVTRLGRDTDTTAAITGQLAGAFYSLGGIPKKWRDDIIWSPEIHALAGEVFERGKADEDARYVDMRDEGEDYRD